MSASSLKDLNTRVGTHHQTDRFILTGGDDGLLREVRVTVLADWDLDDKLAADLRALGTRFAEQYARTCESGEAQAGNCVNVETVEVWLENNRAIDDDWRGVTSVRFTGGPNIAAEVGRELDTLGAKYARLYAEQLANRLANGGNSEHGIPMMVKVSA